MAPVNVGATAAAVKRSCPYTPPSSTFTRKDGATFRKPWTSQVKHCVLSTVVGRLDRPHVPHPVGGVRIDEAGHARSRLISTVGVPLRGCRLGPPQVSHGEPVPDRSVQRRTQRRPDPVQCGRCRRPTIPIHRRAQRREHRRHLTAGQLTEPDPAQVRDQVPLNVLAIRTQCARANPRPRRHPIPQPPFHRPRHRRAILPRTAHPLARADSAADLAGGQEVIAAASAALKAYGLGATASRLVRGSTDRVACPSRRTRSRRQEDTGPWLATSIRTVDSRQG
jgi:hypothetical protein